MYILPNATDFNNACASVDRSIATKCEVISGGITTTMVGDGINGEIISMEWDNIVCSNDGLQIGTTCMDEFKMTYRPVTTTMPLMGKEIHPYVGLEFGSPATVTYVPLGVFYVTNVSSEDEDRTFNITAYDGMQFLMGNADWTPLGVTFPINAWTLLEAIASHFNLTLSYSEELYRLLSSDDYILTTYDSKTLLVHENISVNKNVQVEQPLEGTYRDYIGWIAGLVGAYAHMGRNGELVVSRYVDYGFEVGRDVQHMGGSKINYGGSVTYTAIVSGTDENPVYSTSYSGNAITYSNPFINVAELDLICDELIGQDGITVTPCDVAWRSNPCVDAGDIVSVEDKDGNPLSVYVMERVMSVTGGLAEELHCYGETEIAHTLNKSPLVTKFQQLDGKIENVKSVAEEAKDYINNTVGTFEWIDNGDGTNGGFTIYENGTQSWLRCTAGGIGISPDGGLTYTNAISKNGVVASKLSVVENGVEVLYAGATSTSAELDVRNPSTGNYAMRLMSYTNSLNEPILTYFIRDPNTNNDMFVMESYKLHYVSNYDDVADIRFVNPFSDTSIFRLYSSVSSSDPEHPYTSVDFGTDTDGVGMISAVASAGWLRVQKRSGTRVYYTEYLYNGTIVIGYENDDGTGTSRTVTL